MIVYPAIDIRHGNCVRLFQGDPERETIYGSDPLEVAKKWHEKGASWLHVVDLDGAFSGSPVNYKIVLAIAHNVSVNVQVGGGIRTESDVDMYLSSGVKRIIIGTRAFEDEKWFVETCRKYPGRIVLGLDARDGLVAVRGWRKTTTMNMLDVARWVEDFPIGAIIYTDISRDGTHRGVNVEAIAKLLEVTSHPVIASGGISSLEDIHRLLPLTRNGLDGVIVGRALYDGKLELGSLLEFVERSKGGGDRGR
ncbi:MAG: 1-(5-phosphoribosyl)-5-[(5-phosphoribosylamino)methylideneamino]imidazole-4-carboxamide isomerase [Syntrophobacterales bacterium]|nr:1-(5-phosphoribosyl)-5-[(5-phosphoribosylamino)methylideneamino]imidazole-4-carboxamide isomerase [Syntrophobacterales bacterium]